MDVQFITGVISLVTLGCVWLFLKPQQIQNAAFQDSLDKVTKAIEKLTTELQESREDRIRITTELKNLWKRYDQTEKRCDQLEKRCAQQEKTIADLHDALLECRRNDSSCLKTLKDK